MSGRRTGVFAFTLGSLALAASGAFASSDPPERAGRISFVVGTASYRAAAASQWTPATLNFPITIGDHLWTDRAGRIELQLGAMTVDADAFTAFSVLNLDRQVVQLRITQGTLVARVRGIDEDDALEIDTPNGAVSLLRPGIYRVDVPPAGDSSAVTVRRGEVEIAAGGSAFPVRAGQTAALAGLDRPTHELRGPEALDEFEDWVTFRERRADGLVSERYVSRATVGYEDLDEFGTWRVVASYGPVWVPHVRTEWAPYHFGHWAWVDPWGWTWIDDSPWGFAPFHYGRWVYVTDGWAWVPGTIGARPVYAPALVAFIGGANWRIGVSLGEPVGWFPLGPREVYVPAYQVSPVYVAALNRPHVSVTNVNINVTNTTYVNQSVAGAVTVVPRDTFVQSRAVAAAAVPVTPQSVAAAAVVGHSAPAEIRPVVPARQAASAAAPPVGVANRSVIVRMPPAAGAAPPPAAGAMAGSVPVGSARVGSGPVASTAVPAAAAAPAPATSGPPIVRGAGVERAVVRPPVSETRPSVPPPPPVVAPVTRAAPDRPAAEVATRHAQERVDIEARHAQERADLEARQRAEAASAAEAQARQARERSEMEARQKREHGDLHQRQEAERRR